MAYRALVCAFVAFIAVLTASAAVAQSASRLAVTRCSTSYGVTGQHGPAIPKTLVVAGSTAGLAAYSNGWLTALAPRGWHCAGAVGADGNQELAILPRYVTQVSSSAAAVVVARQWNGVGISTACPFFPELARLAQFSCTTIARREVVSRVSARAIAFEDPAGIHGSGDPSGGSLPAHGVVAYVYQGSGARKQPMVGSATCTLPASEHTRCTAILNDYLARWSRVP